MKVNNVISSPRHLAFGVPQGSVLGPVLFTLYTSPIHRIMRHHGVRDHEYADDTQGYLSFRLGDGGVDQSRAVDKMTQCVSDVDEWLRDNMLKNNIDKLVCMYISSSSVSAKPSHLPLVFGDTTIEPSRSARNLGVLFDDHLTMDQHVSETARKAFSLLRCVA